MSEWVTDWVSDWVTDGPSSREALTSKNFGAKELTKLEHVCILYIV